MPPHTIRVVGHGDVSAVLAAGHLFDHEPTQDLTANFLDRDGHHLLIAYVDGAPAGFVSGIEVAHPDKPLEMLLYELGVDQAFRRRGIATALIGALADLAREQGCAAMWVPIDGGDAIAEATYRKAGASPAEAAGIQVWEL